MICIKEEKLKKKQQKALKKVIHLFLYYLSILIEFDQPTIAISPAQNFHAFLFIYLKFEKLLRDFHKIS